MTQLLRRHRRFRLLWLGETTSGLGSSVSTIVVPLIAVSVLRSSAFVVSALAAAAWAPWLILGLAAGPFVDRVKRKRLMIYCDLVAAGLFASVPIAHHFGHLGVEQLLIVAFGAGSVSVLFTTAYGRFLLDVVVDESDRSHANGLLQGSSSAVRIAGVGAGGLLAGALGAPSALVIDAISFLISAACLARIRVPVSLDDGIRSPHSLRRQVVDGIDFSFRDPLMRPLVLFGGTANLSLVGYQSLLVVFLVRIVGLDAWRVGLLLALMSCGGVIGAFVGNPLARRIGSGRALLLTKLGACPFALLLPLATPGPRAVLVVVGGLGVGIGIVAGNVISSSFFQAYTPTHLFARTSATQNVFSYGMIPIGALLAGALATGVGVRSALWIMTGILPLTGLFLVFSPLLRMRDLPPRSPGWSDSIVSERCGPGSTLRGPLGAGSKMKSPKTVICARAASLRSQHIDSDEAN